MGIKVGDKVRVSKDIPQFYRGYNSYRVFEVEHQVADIEDGLALLDSIPSKYVTILPLKYLTKVNVGAKFKVGDKVVYIGENQEFKGRLFEIDGEIFYNDYHRNMQVRSIKCEDYNVCNVPLSDLEPYTEPTAPTIKVGSDELVDKEVWNCKLKQHGVIKRIANGCAEVFTQYGKMGVWGLADLVDEYDEPFGKWKSVQPKEQTEAEEDARIRQMEAELDEFRKAELDRVLHPEKYHTYEVAIDNVAVDWQRYEADLAKEIAVKITNKKMDNDPLDVANYAVSVAKAIVENLKKK